MKKYILKFWFEHGGTCLWSKNDYARNKFGYAIDNNELPISEGLIEQLYKLEAEYRGYLNWDYPPSPSPWSSEQKSDFKNRANEIYICLKTELGNNFKVINEIEDSVR